VLLLKRETGQRENLGDNAILVLWKAYLGSMEVLICTIDSLNFGILKQTPYNYERFIKLKDET
jgi:hypothetical protein